MLFVLKHSYSYQEKYHEKVNFRFNPVLPVRNACNG